MAGKIKVLEASYGVLIRDDEVYESVAIDREDIPQLIRDLQEHLPFDIDHNKVALPKVE